MMWYHWLIGGVVCVFAFWLGTKMPSFLAVLDYFQRGQRGPGA